MNASSRRIRRYAYVVVALAGALVAMTSRGTTPLAAAELHFQRHDVGDYPSPYQVAVADINGDGKPDVLVLSTQANCVDWFENPTWQKHPIARTASNIDLAPFDLDRNGKPGVALASEFDFADGSAWRSDPMAHARRAGPVVESTVHRPRPGRASAPLGRPRRRRPARAGPCADLRPRLARFYPAPAVAPLGVPAAQTAR